MSDGTTPLSRANDSVVAEQNSVVTERNTPPTVAGNSQVWNSSPPVVAGNTSTAAIRQILPGCGAGNRQFSRETRGLPKAFDVDDDLPENVNTTATHEVANLALKYFRELTDPYRSGEPMYYEVDITNAGPIDVPVPKRYSRDVMDTLDARNRSAIGAQYYYKDRDGNSVVTETVRFDPQVFVKCLVRFGDLTMLSNDEVVCLEWRAWPGSVDDTMETTNETCAQLALDPPVTFYKYAPPK